MLCRCSGDPWPRDRVLDASPRGPCSTKQVLDNFILVQNDPNTGNLRNLY